MTVFRILAAILTVVLLASGCDDAGNPVQPRVLPVPSPVRLEHSGPVTIVFLEATPAPGKRLVGCGPNIAGCVNRVAMRFSLRAREAGHVLAVRAFLHATNLRACLLAESGSFDLARGETRPLTVVFDRAEGCGVPLTIATMAVVVEGTVEVASRQTWNVTYSFER